MGRAWESDDTAGVSEVTVAVGVDDPTVLDGALATARERIDTLERENDRKVERIECLEADNDRLRDRLAAVEAHLGLDATQPRTADD